MSSLKPSLMLVLATCSAFPAPGQDFEAYCLNLRLNYPNEGTSWSNNAQGVAHDADNWYITQTHTLRKIPVERDLRTVSSDDPGVIEIELDAIAPPGYDHFGDPDVYRYHHTDGSDTDYLVLPIEDSDRVNPGAICVVRASDFTLHGFAVLPNQCGGPDSCFDSGWCAVDPDGLLYTSHQRATVLITYAVDWARVHILREVAVIPDGVFSMLKEDGTQLTLFTSQGGEFAPGGRSLYLVSGYYTDSNERADEEGIHVVERDSNVQPPVWRRVAHSTRGYGHFDYYYNPGDPEREEPEGLTIWDLDDGRAPGIRGQLHVFVSDLEIFDDIDFKHYTNIIRVVAGGGCAYAACCSPAPPLGCPTPFNETCEFGVQQCPFRTVGGAANLAWNGSEIRIRSGTYNETLTISNRVRLTAEGGTARIGG